MMLKPQKGSGPQQGSPAPWRELIMWGFILFPLMAWIIFVFSATALPQADNSRPKQFKLSQPHASPTMTYTEFQTTFPSAIGDSTLMPLLQGHKVIVDASHPSTPWLLEFLSTWFPMLLLL